LQRINSRCTYLSVKPKSMFDCEKEQHKSLVFPLTEMKMSFTSGRETQTPRSVWDEPAASFDQNRL
jgi:hypothetical protein